MRNDLTIRRLTDKNLQSYEAVAQLYDYAYPLEKITPLSLLMDDYARSQNYVCERFIAEQNNIVAGTACFEHWAEFYHPRKFLLHVIVAPNFQKQGVGAALYLRANEELEKHNPLSVAAWIRQNRADDIRFAERRGFQKEKIKWNIALDLKTCNLDQFIEQAEAVERHGIQIKQFSQLESDVDRERKLYDLHLRTTANLETLEDLKIPSFDEFVASQRQRSPELVFVAVHHDRFVGMWQFENTPDGRLFGSLLGVDEHYRRQSVAIALTVRSILYAKANHYTALVANIAEHNQASLSLAQKMGFTRLPADVLFRRTWVEK